MVKTVKELDHPNIIIAADHDEAGIEAAKATGLPYALPEKEGWDWWDVYNTSGIEVVKKHLTILNGKNERSSKPDGKLFTKLSDIDRTAPVPIIEDMILPEHLSQ